jgi:hypothetical protein
MQGGQRLMVAAGCRFKIVGEVTVERSHALWRDEETRKATGCPIQRDGHFARTRVIPFSTQPGRP